MHTLRRRCVSSRTRGWVVGAAAAAAAAAAAEVAVVGAGTAATGALGGAGRAAEIADTDVEAEPVDTAAEAETVDTNADTVADTACVAIHSDAARRALVVATAAKPAVEPADTHLSVSFENIIL